MAQSSEHALLPAADSSTPILTHLRRLLEDGGDIEDEDSSGRTRLRRAVTWPDLPITQLLIDLGADVHAKDKSHGRQPLHHAAYWTMAGSAPYSFDSRTEIMQALLDAGADLEAEDDFGDTPLSLASKDGRASTVRFLLRRGANPSSHGKRGCALPQYIADLLRLDECDVLSALLQGGSGIHEKDCDGDTMIGRAAWLGSAAAVIGLLEAGADPNASGRQGLRPLHFAAELMNDPEGPRAFRALVEAGADVDARSEFGSTPLHVAAFHGSPPAVRALLEAGADPHVRGKHGYGPLHYAYALADQPDGAGALKALLEKGVDVNEIGDDNTMLLVRSAFRGSSAAVRILREAGGRAWVKNRFSSDLVQFAAEMMRDGEQACADVIAVLLQAGADASAPNRAGISLIQYAISISSVPLVNVLVTEGAMSSLSMMEQIRELASSSTECSRHIALLSELYATFKSYPSEPPLHEYEIERTKPRSSKSGGFGECWEGMFLGCHPVAMKRALPATPDTIAHRRAMREIKAWMNLRHPNILPFIGTFIEERAIYMVSPWMSNGSLPQYLKQNLRVNRLKLLQEIAEGLHYLHTLQPAVVHGDIKGDNILISDSGTACIADFGLSERLAQKSATENSNTWYTAGNPRWQAPELLNAVTYAEVRRTTQSDMFAFGRVIFEVVAGEKPFAAIENSSAIIPLVIKGLFPERPSGFGDRLWNLMKECCHLYPSNRPSAQYVVHRLRKPHGVRAGLLAAFRASTM